MTYLDKYILVVCGGISSEREVSLRSGKAIFDALSNKGYQHVELFDLREDNAIEIIARRPDIVFLGLHGKGGEDGTIQGFLELSGIPYTGPGICSSAVCMDKIATKRILTGAGLPTARFEVLDRGAAVDCAQEAAHIRETFGFPVVLKSPSQGSSIGLEIVRSEEEAAAAIKELFLLDKQILVEQFLEGIEITLPIMGNEELTTLPIIEITSEGDFYDYTAKYTNGLSHHIIPACIDEATARQVKALGEKAYRVCGCTGLSRVDFIVDRLSGPMIIEIDTLPGMTEMSLFPDAARYVGITFEELVERILTYGFETKRCLN